MARRSAHVRSSGRTARTPYGADASAWVAHCRRAGARLDADGRAADAVAWCAAGRASSFALPTKLRHLDRHGVDRVLDAIAAGEAHPRLALHVVRVGEGAGSVHVLATDAEPDGRTLGVVGHVGAHHVAWISALPAHAVGALAVVVLQITGGQYGVRSRGLNVALVGIGAALRLADAPAPVAVSEPAAWYRAVRPRRPSVAFLLGRVVATPAALASGADLLALLARHAAGDWGDLDAHDARANAEALDLGGRLLSSYETPAGVLWVITEADRSATTVLRPEDY